MVRRTGRSHRPSAPPHEDHRRRERWLQNPHPSLPPFSVREDLMEQNMSAVAFACLMVALLVVAVLLVRQRQIAARLRKRNALLHNNVLIRDEELRHLVTTRVPALVDVLYGRPV